MVLDKKGDKNMKKRICSLLLVLALGGTIMVPAQSVEADAAGKKPTISAQKLTITKGKTKSLKIINTKKKVVWRQNTKKYVKLKKVGKYKVKLTGKKAGTTKITAKVGKKKFTCKVTVKSVKPNNTETPTVVPTATPVAKTDITLDKKILNEISEADGILERHANFYVKTKEAGREELVHEMYFANDFLYSRMDNEEMWMTPDRELFWYDEHVVGLSLAENRDSYWESLLAESLYCWQIEENEEILSSYLENGKIYLETKTPYRYREVILDESTWEILKFDEYLYQEDGTKEWIRTREFSYGIELPERVEKFEEIYQSETVDAEENMRTVTAVLESGMTNEKEICFKIKKGLRFSFSCDEIFFAKYGYNTYKDEDCTESFTIEDDDKQSNVKIYFRAVENEAEESGGIDYADGVTSKMSKADFWADLSDKADKVLATKEQIAAINKDIVTDTDTYMYDLKAIKETYNGVKRRDNLANSVVTDANRTNYYANGVKVDKTEYFAALQSSIAANENVTENDKNTYAVCTKRTEVKWCPTNDYIGYSATDTDDESVSAAIAVNEPMVIQATTADGKFYWGYTENCTGWVAAEDMAICNSKEEWLDAWEVDATKNDFIVVTTDRVVTETSFYNPDISDKTLTLGTRLKLVEEEKIPDMLDGRGTWHNYVVYMPTRDENGNYVKKMAMISEHSDVSVGYLPFTERNILKVAFECLGNRYGWGGCLNAMDCSLYVSYVYRCFGFALPRNTTWQQAINSCTNISGDTDEEKENKIKKIHVGSVLYFSGHEMLYLGRYKGRMYVISALGTLYDVGDENVRSVYSVAINTLDAKRKNGNTWLTNLTGINSFEKVETVG